MAKCTPEQLSKWLFVHLQDSPLSEDIPRENLSLICDRAVSFFFSKDVLALEGIFNWLTAEYNVPRERLAASFGSLKIPASELGVFMQLPGEENDSCTSQTLPGDRPLSALADPGETFGEDELPHEGDGPRTAAPVNADDAEDEAPVFIEERPPEAPAQAAAPSPAVPQARPKRHWQMLPPRPRDPARSLSGFLTDSKYLEFAFLDYALEGDCRIDTRLRLLCSTIFRLRDHEKEFYRNPSLEPGTDADTVEAWAVRLNGLALAFAFAKEVARDDDLDQAEWLRGVRQLNGIVGDLSSRILFKLAEAKKIGGDTLGSFETAWSRLRFGRDSLSKETDRISAAAAGKDAEVKKSPGVKRPVKAAAVKPVMIEAEAEGLAGFFRRYQLLFVAGSVVLLFAALGYAAVSLGFIGGKKTVQKSELDVSAAGLKVKQELTDGVGLVVVVDDAEWRALSAEDKHAKLAKLYEITAAAGLSQVQVRGAEDKVLGLAMSAQVIKVFE